MNTWLILMIVIAVIIVGLAVFMMITQRKRNEAPNYRSWLVIGICWIPLGIATRNPAFYIMGAVFIVISLLNKDKWREEKKWNEHTPSEKALKIVLICIVLLMLLAIIVLLFLHKKLVF